jgi:hypothetical protein
VSGDHALISSQEAEVLTRSVVAVLMTVLPIPRAATPAETLGTEVVVRVYDASDADAKGRQGSLDLAASIVSTASIDVLWVPCHRSAHSDSPAARCHLPLATGELSLRLLRSAAAPVAGRGLPLGEAFIDPRSRHGVLATVYVDRVARIATQAGIDERTLLGRAIAHELAHLLMATSDHGSVGLMRAVWLRHELQRGDARDWSLAPADVSRIRERTPRTATPSLASAQ